MFWAGVGQFSKVHTRSLRIQHHQLRQIQRGRYCVAQIRSPRTQKVPNVRFASICERFASEILSSHHLTRDGGRAILHPNRVTADRVVRSISNANSREGECRRPPTPHQPRHVARRDGWMASSSKPMVVVTKRPKKHGAKNEATLPRRSAGRCRS